ncbi:1-acyl-sn-glycerol-3-phosphate acyltransferase [Pseudonocardia sp. KRD-184]|uniref:1-acyl-sn-glycerol-3-phosphate acyltransferase n=1 Tax=Pseudonocardia oceani TaxID=2792013 RepID=A0ABS6UA22_9PSEU|nr:lysophospholipid acyltransferase family protein [Pseudonocardia oceani]MBW0089311.1 1-acyl-sn-glycerol-3-phosphate acyltransferase [Pseudonocardia oceani]MBW0095270.1 1-acyl-sn-glycerol-3-phosphate acyltransferase [Pseudonocardia oceani]MBW0109074.1 1-acyl-sn-glycerol-3-phosphate acyltransferase [Pseudonocardia oceani]MBW0121637.1 1-acyl-sn-glycerol-3-phosphate acyltransferase [Pseudonocardia oceani]MBW0129084.1 1-acyl-sn-glycerol-3-phosphate acyltransferase [Pseudonocardia oceani]
MHLLVRFLLAPLARLLWRPVVQGVERLPARGPLILAANHRAAVDTAVIALTARRPVAFLGKAEYFVGRGIRGRALARFLTALGYVPVDRASARAGLDALHAGRSVLEAGGAFAIYPEGTRSLDGRLHRGHTGVATLALGTGALVVPVALLGTERVQPVGKKLPRLRRVVIRYGEPLDFSRYDGLQSAPAIRRAVTDQIMDAIATLSQQEYVDTYHERPAA